MQGAAEHGGSGPAAPRVVIVGAGFGGLAVARGLAGAPVEALLVDRSNYHLFTPLLYQVATSGLEPEQIAHPVRAILRDAPNVAFRIATVTGVDLAARQLCTDAGPIAYDMLVLAAGSATNFFGVTSPAALGLKDLNEALTLRNHILRRCEQAAWETDGARRRALLTFVVVGGGPTGVELAGALSELVRRVLPHDFPGVDFGEARIILLEAMDTILSTFRHRLQRAALRDLRAKGIEVRFGARVADVTSETVVLDGGGRIDAGTLVWAAGVRAGDLSAAVAAARGRGGRLMVDRFLRVPGHPEVFAIGDIAAFEQDGQTLAMLAPVAVQQGEHVAATVRRTLAGLPPRRFRYRDKGTMATIGRNSAVAQLGPVSLTGFLAWLAWVLLHLMQIVGFRNRLLVFINWLWNYVTYDRAVRLILAAPPTPERDSVARGAGEAGNGKGADSATAGAASMR
ncbi:MAG: NAD(P)/FAD-dependent oxidoreductase [Dehalococcoidia bacterium]